MPMMVMKYIMIKFNFEVKVQQQQCIDEQNNGQTKSNQKTYNCGYNTAY